MEFNFAAVTEFLERISEVGWVVIAILFIMSVACWVIMVSKWMSLRRTRRATQQFEDIFWSGGDLNQLNSTIDQRGSKSAIERIFQAGYREFSRLRNSAVGRGEMIDIISRNMKANMRREMDKLEHQVPFLATAGSSATYIGLFGTVIGIMVALIELEGMKNVTIAKIAPAIAEPLIATAAGLFVAIPAIIGYNALMSRVDSLDSRIGVFIEEFSAILERNMVPDDAPAVQAASTAPSVNPGALAVNAEEVGNTTKSNTPKT